jgi:hypothetical protein
LIDDRRYADYFAEVAELERLATKICEFAPALVPGLLQTAAYARAVTVAMNPFTPDEYIAEKVSGRLEGASRRLRRSASGRPLTRLAPARVRSERAARGKRVPRSVCGAAGRPAGLRCGRARASPARRAGLAAWVSAW